MADPYAPVQPGDDLTFKASAWNAMLRAGKAFLRSELDTRVPGPAIVSSATIIRVLNMTDDLMPRNSVMGIGDPISTPDDSTLDNFMKEVTFRVAKPDKNKHKRKYVVLLDPAPAHMVVRAYIAGVCQVKVDQQDETHEYANIVDTVTDHMKSSRHGHARILWREGLQAGGYGYYEGGIQWAIVMLGVTGSSDAIGHAAGAITGFSGGFYGAGLVGLWVSSGAYGSDGPVETIEVLNPGPSISSGKRVAVAWDADDVAYVAPLECE